MTTSNLPDEITFDFVRSPHFRVVHSNGAWGGITPRRELSVTFYSERGSIPDSVTHALASDGLGSEIRRTGTNNVQRECEVEVLMSMQDAVNLHRWLESRIEEWRTIEANSPSVNQAEAS